jgi:carboxypeptidase Taq
MSECSVFEEPRFAALVEAYRRLALVRSISATLGWDEQTYLPPAAAEYRGEQAAYLARESHGLLTSDRLGELLEAATGALGEVNDGAGAALVREVARERRRAMVLSEDFVGTLSRVTTAAFHGWQRARREERFRDFAPHLEEVLRLKREEAALVMGVLAPEGGMTPYEALMDEYEPGFREADAQRLFTDLRLPLTQLVREAEQQTPVEGPDPLKGVYPEVAQRAFLEEMLGAMGFDLSAGRMDSSTHPFCTTLGPRDTRITTRYDENDLGDALFSVLHEMGHGLYEQGLPEAWQGTPLGEAVSLGVHESQSRLWENFIGRSEAFWRWLLPRIRKSFAACGHAGADLNDWMRSVHRVSRSYIRVDADEVTYNLHVLLRFELEQQLIGGRLEVRDLPQAWNQLMEELLGLPPKGDRLGCLQDVHWSGGAFGYFPTYTIGNVQAASLMRKIRQDLPELEEDLAAGRFGELLHWLRVNVHQHGRLFSGGDLVRRATGAPVTAGPLLDHLTQKVRRFGE